MPRTLAGTRNPVPSYALQFAVTNNVVTVTNASALQGLTSMTVEAWVYLNSRPPSSLQIVNYFANPKGFQMFINVNRGITAQVGNSTTNGNGTSATKLDPLKWYHIAVSWDGTTVRWFINGVLDATTAGLSGGNTGNPAVNLQIGGSGSSGTGFPGIIQEVRVSNNARYTSTFTPQTTPFTNDANTVGLWHLADGSGTSIADSGSNSLTGTTTGSPVWVAGYLAGAGTPYTRSSAGNRFLLGSALYFNNINGSQYVKAGTGDILKLLPALTISAWIYPIDTSSHARAIVANWQDQTVLFRVNGTGANNLQGFLHLASAGQIGGGFNFSAIGLQQWYHVLITWDGTKLTGYLNNVAGSTTYSNAGGDVILNTGTGFLSIGGANRVASEGQFCGAIDEVRIYNRALNTTEITTLYNKGDVQSGLIAYYPMDIYNNTTTILDKTGANNGIIVGGADFGVGTVPISNSPLRTQVT